MAPKQPPKQSVMDKVARHFPGWALRRSLAQRNLDMLSSAATHPGYDGGRPDRRQQELLFPSNSEEESIYCYDYDQMRARAMNLYRNDPFTRSIVDTVVRYMGQSRPSAKTRDPEWNKRADEFFNDRWWDQADARRRPGVDFGTLQSLWDRTAWMQGDMLSAIWEGGLYPYEGIQIETPPDLRGDKSVVNGVRVQKSIPNRITHFYVKKPGSGSRFTRHTKGDYQRFRQSQVFYSPSRYWRIAMLRGVPELHSVIDALDAFDRTNCNVASKIQFESQLWTIERKNAITGGDRKWSTPAGGDSATEITKGKYGMRVKTSGDPSKDFVMGGLENPGAQYVPYMEFAARVVSAGIGLPYDIVMHIYNSSYTASRAARCDLKAFVMERWLHRGKVFCQPVRNWRIAKAIKEGVLPPAPVDKATGISEWWKCDWSLPTFEQIDRVKDSNGDKAEWGMGQLSMGDMAQRRNSTLAKSLDAHDEDMREIKRRANALGVSMNMYMGTLFDLGAEPELEISKQKARDEDDED